VSFDDGILETCKNKLKNPMIAINVITWLVVT